MDNRFTVPLIQAARGVAVILVMIFHTSQMANKYFHLDFLGVSGMGQSGAYTYFFVLTGFLMFSIYQRHFGNSQMWLPFVVKRLIRIYPVYWIVTAAVIPIYILVPSFGFGYETRLPEIVTSLLLFPYIQAPILPVAWSLVYIVSFYLAFSMFFILEKKTMLALFTLWIIVVGLHSQGWIHIKNEVLLQFIFSGVHLQFVLGMLIAFVIGRIKIGYSQYWLCAGILLFPLVWLLKFMNPMFSYADGMYAIGSSLMLLGIGMLRINIPAWLKPLQFLGDASYAVLLTSLGFLSLTLKLSRVVHLEGWCGPVLTTCICFLAALSMCCTFYYYIEKPLVNRLKIATAGMTQRAPAR